MTHALKLEVGSPHVLRDHLRTAALAYGEGTNVWDTLSDALEQIEAQLPKPAIEEPTEFGSVVRGHFPQGKDILWLRTGDSWVAELGGFTAPGTGLLTITEVLRIGVGTERYIDGEIDQQAAEALARPL